MEGNVIIESVYGNLNFENEKSNTMGTNSYWERICEPIFVDTDIDYQLDMSLFPGMDDPHKCRESQLQIHSGELCTCCIALRGLSVKGIHSTDTEMPYSDHVNCEERIFGIGKEEIWIWSLTCLLLIYLYT